MELFSIRIQRTFQLVSTYITAKQFKNRCAFPALKIFSASLHVTILLIYYSTILLLY